MFVLARETRSSKGPRRSEIAQAASSAVGVARARNKRVTLGLEACEECTSCFSGDTSSMHQEHAGLVKNRDTKKMRTYFEMGTDGHRLFRF